MANGSATVPIPIPIKASAESLRHTQPTHLAIVNDFDERSGVIWAEVRRETGADVSIGYHDNRFHVFWLSLWTWGGQHILYAGDNYRVLEPADWEELLGSPTS